jgi:hypothetical protein
MNAGEAWGFSFRYGTQDTGGKNSKLFVWAVHPGDVIDLVRAPSRVSPFKTGPQSRPRLPDTGY